MNTYVMQVVDNHATIYYITIMVLMMIYRNRMIYVANKRNTIISIGPTPKILSLIFEVSLCGLRR